jgi:hypothetical protein
MLVSDFFFLILLILLDFTTADAVGLHSLALTRHSQLLLHIDHLVTHTMAVWLKSRQKILLLDQAKQLTFNLTVKHSVINCGPFKCGEKN